MARFRRKDLKGPDQFVTTTTTAILWAEEHRPKVYMAAAAAVGVLLLIGGLGAVRASRARQVNQEIAQGLSQLHGDKYAAAATELSGVGERWNGTTPGTIASLFATQANLLAKNQDGALAAAQKVADEGASPDYLEQQALVLLAGVEEGKGDFARAAESYGKARGADGPYTAIALLGEARMRERQGDSAKAIELYQSFVDEYPESKDQAYASARLTLLKAS